MLAEGRYPERLAGGFPRNSHHLLFYSRVRALLGPGARVLDFGAGRGKFAERFLSEGQGYLADLIDLRSTGARVVGCDVDPAVATNPLLDDRVILDRTGRLPFADGSFDLVVSWAVFEHITDPDRVAAELSRVVRPGGWICAWTPQRWGLIGLGARLVPNRWHASVLTRVFKTARGEQDIFPTVYGMNSAAALRRLFPVPHHVHVSYPFTGPNAMLTRWALSRTIATAYAAIPGGRTETFLHVFIQKSDGAP